MIIQGLEITDKAIFGIYKSNHTVKRGRYFIGGCDEFFDSGFE